MCLTQQASAAYSIVLCQSAETDVDSFKLCVCLVKSRANSSPGLVSSHLGRRAQK